MLCRQISENQPVKTISLFGNRDWFWIEVENWRSANKKQLEKRPAVTNNVKVQYMVRWDTKPRCLTQTTSNMLQANQEKMRHRNSKYTFYMSLRRDVFMSQMRTLLLRQTCRFSIKNLRFGAKWSGIRRQICLFWWKTSKF